MNEATVGAQSRSPLADARALALPDRYRARAPPFKTDLLGGPAPTRSGVTPLGFALLHLQLRDAYTAMLAGVEPGDVGLEGVPDSLGEQGVLEGAAWALAALGLASEVSTTEPPPTPEAEEEKKGDDPVPGWLRPSAELQAYMRQKAKEPAALL